MPFCRVLPIIPSQEHTVLPQTTFGELRGVRMRGRREDNETGSRNREGQGKRESTGNVEGRERMELNEKSPPRLGLLNHCLLSCHHISEIVFRIW